MKTILLVLTTLLSAPDTRAATALIDRDSSYEEALSGFTAEELEQEVYALPVEVFESELPELEIEEVRNTSTLKLLGRGISPRGGKGESLGIACYTPGAGFKYEIYDRECPTVRFVWFKSSKEAFYIGETIGMPGAGTAKLKKKALKAVLRDFFNRHQTPASEEQIHRHFVRSFILLVGASTLIALNLPMTATGAVIGGWSQMWKMFAVPIGIFFLSTNVDVEDAMVSGTLIDARMTDEKGWNWAGKPKKLGKRKYGIILGQIVKGRRINYDHHNKEQKVRRLYQRLSRQGVQFARPVGY